MGIITISREVGSYGDEIAAMVAEKLGYELMDREQVHKLVRQCDAEFSRACEAFAEEVKPRGFFERLSFSNPSFTALFEALNYEAALEGNVVMLGRGAQVAFAKVPGVLKCRVVAPLELRVQRIMKKKGMSREEALEFVQRYGRERRALLESIYRVDLYSPSNFDLVLNTAGFELDQAVELVVQAARFLEANADLKSRDTLLKNLALAKRIESAIKKQISTLPAHELTVEFQDGVATLRGLVSTPKAKAKAEKIAAGFEGVTKVDNQLRTAELTF